jgi:hypothetical protein
MGWRSSSPSLNWARCAAGSLAVVDSIRTTWSWRIGWRLMDWCVARYRPLRMCRCSMMSCSGRAILRAMLRYGEVVGGDGADPSAAREYSAVV